jgi:hypothetical protein
VLYIKKEKVLDKRALKGNQGAADNSTTDNNGPVFKEVRPVKLDFSATNFKTKVTGWRLSIEKKADTLFPTVCDTARRIAGIIAASVISTELAHQDPQILARANLPSEDEEEDEKDNTQATDIHKNSDNGIDRDDSSDNNRDDNGVDGSNDREVDGGNDSGVDEDEGDSLDASGHDNGDMIDISSGNEEDEDISGLSDDEAASEVSDLTEIGSSSDVTGSRRKRAQRG